MKIEFDKNVDYCIYIGVIQTGKTFIFRSMESDSIHQTKKLYPNIINVLSLSTVFENKNILGVYQYITSLKTKLNGCCMLSVDFFAALLKHINYIIVHYDKEYTMDINHIKKILMEIMYPHYYTLKLFKDYNISYTEKDIVSLPSGMIDVNDFFKRDIEKYSLNVDHLFYEKFDCEGSYEEHKQLIDKNAFNIHNIKKTFNLSDVMYIKNEMERDIKTKYGF